MVMMKEGSSQAKDDSPEELSVPEKVQGSRRMGKQATVQTEQKL